jgi:cell division septation protein DedD
MLSQNKPGATPASAPQKAQSQPAQESVDTSATAVSASAPTSVAATYPVAKQDKPAGQNAAVVQAALPAQGPGAQPVTAGGQVQSAMGSSTAWMVQIAAVSHQEDADVLTGALRKRGYVVTARRDPVDGLLHVQVGPFATHSEANSMRQRLLDDGYNAIIEP